MSDEFKNLSQRLCEAEALIESLNMRVFLAEREARCVEKRLQDRIDLAAGAAGCVSEFPVPHVNVPIAKRLLAPLQRAIQHYLDAPMETLITDSREDLVNLHAFIKTIDLVKDRSSRGY